MRVLRLHVAVTVASAMVLVMALLVGLNFLAVLADEFGDIRGQYNFAALLYYALWRLPGLVADSISFVALIGCLVGLGALANQNELTVMRASGISLLQIFGMVMLPVLVLMILGSVTKEVSAYTDRHAENTRAVALAMPKNENQNEKKKKRRPSIKWEDVILQEKGVWNRQENEFVRFDKVFPDGKIFGITRIAFDENQQIVAIQHAQRGFFENEGWRLEKITTQEFSEERLRYSSQESLRWNSTLTPERLMFVSEDPENLSTGELVDYSIFLKAQSRDNRAYQLEYWKRVLKPAALLSLVLIAVSFVFGPLRQVSVAQRIFAGVIMGVGFSIFQDMVGTSSLVFGFNPLSGVLLPIMVCGLIGLVMLYRVR